jgi:ubiquinone/menaquinone biosynthesis C-methylase UbiE
MAIACECVDPEASGRGVTVTLLVPIRFGRDIAADYKRLAMSDDIRNLNGRVDFDERTDVMMSFIREHMDFPDHARVLDIGCGDARLLRSLIKVSQRAGTVLTQDELERLRGEQSLSRIEFHAGNATSLKTVLKGRQFDRIVANSWLSSVGSRSEALRTLRIISDMVAPGGKLWLGELFSRPHPNPKFERYSRQYSSRADAITQIWKRRGAVPALKLAKHIARHWDRSDSIIEVGRWLGPWWYTNKIEIKSFAHLFGFTIDGIWDCEKETGDPFYAVNGRFSVLLSKCTY